MFGSSRGALQSKKCFPAVLVGLFCFITPAIATNLNPSFISVGPDTINVSWTPVGTSSYTAVLSTTSGFTTIFATQTVGFSNKNYFSLPSCTTFYFQVKISTEPDGAYAAISTMTVCGIGGNKMLHFNPGNTQVVKVPHNSAYNGGANTTMEFWLRRSSATNTSNKQHLISKDNNVQLAGWGIFLQNGTPTIRFESFNQGGLTGSIPISDTNWHHFALTRDSSGTTKMYLDGNLDTTGNTTNPIVTASSFLKFGNSDNLGNGFEGDLDEIRIWDVVKNQAEINCARRLNLTGLESNLMSYWNLNEGSGQIAEATGVVKNHGVLGISSNTETQDPSWQPSNIPNFGTSCDVTAPLGAILNPVNGSTVPISALNTLSGTSNDTESGVKEVTFRLQRLADGSYWRRVGNYWGTGIPAPENLTDALINWSIPGNIISWSTGNYTLNVTVTDNDFNSVTMTSNFSVVTDTESVVPTVVINFPVSGQTYTDSQLTYFNGVSSDNVSVALVKVKLIRFDSKEWNGPNVAWQNPPQINNANGLLNWDYTLPISAWVQNGTYTLVVTAFDQSGNQGSQTVDFTMSNSSGGADAVYPTVQILHPLNNTTHAPSALSALNGTANDNSGFLDVSLSVRDLNNSNYWNGTGFVSASEYLFYLGNVPNWTYGGIPEGQWIDGRQYRLTVYARDAAYNITTSSSNFTVSVSSAGDTIPPFINISSPTDGFSTTPSSLTINGSAGDNVSLKDIRVSVRNNTTGLYYDGNGFNAGAQNLLLASGLSAWSLYIPAPAYANGSYYLLARAEDTAGLISSQTVTFNITGAAGGGDVTPPTAAILMPVLGGTYNGSTSLTTISGTCQDDVAVSNTRVWLRDDNNKYYDGAGWTSNDPVYQSVQTTLNWFTSIPAGAWKNGTFIAFFDCRDTSNNITTLSSSFTMTGISGGGNADTNPPAIVINNPPNNTTQNANSFTHLNGYATDAFGVTQVKLELRKGTSYYFDGTSFSAISPVTLYPTLTNATASSVDWYYDVLSSIYIDGAYTLTVKATDPSLNVATQTVTFNVTGSNGGGADLYSPTIAITSFANNDTRTDAQMTISSGTASDDVALALVECEIFRNSDGKWWNGAAWQNTFVRLTANGLVNWNITLPIAMWSTGTYIVTARAKDTSGKTTQVSNNLTISSAGGGGTPPTITITNVTAGQTYTPANLLSYNGNSDGISVRARTTDLNLNLDWDPVQALWRTQTTWSDATMGAGTWNLPVAKLPTYWPNGHFKISAEATGSNGLLSTTETDFYVSVSSGNGGGGTNDFISPAAINTLTAQTGSAVGSVKLQWTSVGDDGNAGTASSYVIKYSMNPISTEAEWTAANDVSAAPLNMAPPVPLVNGTVQNMTVTNLTPGVATFWGIRAKDEVFNRGPLSNSPSAVAFVGCQAGVGDGEGTAVLSQPTMPTGTDTSLTLTLTVGSHGITDGGKILIRVPDGGWAYPQITTPGMSGYFTATTSNGSVSLTRETDGQVMKLLVTGTLNAQDTVTVSFITRSYSCTLQSGIPFRVMTQASSCGAPTVIASQPTITTVLGSAAWIGFESYEKFAQVGSIITVPIRGQDFCGNTASVTASVNIQAAVVIRDTTTYTYNPDAVAALSLAPDMSGSFSNGPIVLSTGQSTLNLYYRLTANNGQEHKIKINYTAIGQSYTTENLLNIFPTTGAGISSVSIDKSAVGNATTVTFNPLNETAFINYQTVPNLSSVVKIYNSGNQLINQLWSYGTPVRVAWTGQRTTPTYDMAPAGNYHFVIEAAGEQDTSLTATLQTVGVSGTVRTTGSLVTVANANVNLYGPVTRYTQTDNSGVFSFSGIPAGQYSIHVDKLGYGSKDVSFTFNGTNTTLADTLIDALAKIVVDMSRANTSSELWGSVRTIDSTTNQEIWTSVHFGYGRGDADNGLYANANNSKPEILLRPNVAYQVRLDMPGYSTTPLSRTLADAEVYNWTVTITPKKGVSGQITLGNGISNGTGQWIYISATKSPDTSPTKFASAYIPPGEFQTTYSLLDLDAGSYQIVYNAAGLSPQSIPITIAASDVTQNITLSQGGSATLNLTFTGNTTDAALDLKDGSSDGYFPVTVRYNNGQVGGSQIISVAAGSGGSSKTTTLTGLSNGTYNVFFDPIDGFSLNVPSPQTLTIAASIGSLNSTFVQDSGSLTGTIVFPAGGANMGNTNFYLFRENIYRTSPTLLNATQFRFSNLGSGRYTLSVYNTAANVSKIIDVYLTNGQPTNLSIDLNAVQTYSLSGTVRTLMAPPNDSLTVIDAASTPTTFYTLSGAVIVPALRVQAQLLNTNGTVDPLPVSTGMLLDPIKLKYGVVNPADGTYSITGLEQGKTYRVGLYTDLNNDGTPDLPRDDRNLALSSNLIGTDFTIRDGGKIQLALTSPNSESAYALRLDLVDTVLKRTVQSQTISLVGTSATIEFSNLQVGNYLINVIDPASPVKYTVKPIFVKLDSIGQTKTAAATLVEAGRVQLTLADRYGTLVISSNESLLLPTGFKVKLVSVDQILFATLDSDGKYKAPLVPGLDYTVKIEPPAEIRESDVDKAFLPVQLNAHVDHGGDILDLGVVVLKAGDSVTGTITGDTGSPLAHVLVQAYQTMAKNIPPLVTYTNDLGIFTFKNLSIVTRYYDFVANPVGHADALPTWSEGTKKSVDITKPAQATAADIVLAAANGSISGTITPVAGTTLIAAYGSKAGQLGASILVAPRGVQKIFEFVSRPDGTFSIPLPRGLYDVEILAKGHQQRRITSVSITDQNIALGTFGLISGVSLQGTIRMSDGSLPSTDKVNELFAVDTFKNRVRAEITKVSVDAIESVEGYTLNGLAAGSVIDVKAVTSNGRVVTLESSYNVPSSDSQLNLDYSVSAPDLRVSFITKDPQANNITAQFDCTQAYLNSPDDLDLDGTADSEEFDNFVTKQAGAGTLAFGSVTPDRTRATYIYTMGSETLPALVLDADFTTDTLDPQTGLNFTASGSFTHPFGLSAQRSEYVGESGAEVPLTDGSVINFPAGAFNLDSNAGDDGVLVKFVASDDINNVSSELDLGSSALAGAKFVAQANKLGPKAYPAGIYKAIKALENAPTVNPFSSFYDVFLPAGVSHLFDRNNKPTITLKYDTTADPSTINIYYFNETQGVYTIENDDRRVDTLNHTISVSIGHASVFTVLESSAPLIQGDAFSGTLDVFNFPNPFDLTVKTVTLLNPGSNSSNQTIKGTMIKISVPAGMAGSGQIEIFNMAGQLVRTIDTGTLTAGAHNYIEWDGTNEHVADVASGVYIGRLKIGSEVRFFKMAVVK